MSQAVIDACNVIIENKDHRSVNYCCVKYAKECRYMCLAGYPPKDVKVQIRYILKNMAYWRGQTAKQVRSTLKAYNREDREL
jgi:hypothetical protein